MTRVKWAPGALQEIATSREVGDILRGAGTRVLAAAVSAAPVRTGRFAASLRLEVRNRGDRMVATVSSDRVAAVPIDVASATLRTALRTAAR